MTNELKPIRTEADYDKALREVERLWGAKSGTRNGDRLEVLATLIDAYEAEHYPMDPPIRSRRSSSAWSNKGCPARTWNLSSERERASRRFLTANVTCQSA